MNDAPLLVLAAGGTGGHMFPAQAVAEMMLSRGWQVVLSTDARGSRYSGGFPDEVVVEVVASGTFAKSGLVNKFFVPFHIFRGILSAFGAMRRRRPNVVVGFGGYPAIPAMASAITLGIPCMLHEQNGVLGKVNRLFVSHANKVVCGTSPTGFPENVKVHYLGNPVRQAVLSKHGSCYIQPGDYPMDLLVIGGSQGAKILSDIVPKSVSLLSEKLRKNLRISQQARVEDCMRVSEAYAEMGIRADIKPFFQDISERINQAQLVISRSGASSVADISIIGRPSILVPLAAAIRDEQTANARELVDSGAAILLPEDQFTPEKVADQIQTIFDDGNRAQNMANAALACAKPTATVDISNMIQDFDRDI